MRRARPVRRRRGRHRDARPLAGDERRPGLRRGVPRAGHADGAARPLAPVRHRLVARQRVRLRAVARRDGRVDPARRPVAAAALRGRVQPRPRCRQPGDRHRLPDVRVGRAHRAVVGRRSGPAAADPVRVQPRDGPGRRSRRLLGGVRRRSRGCRAGSCGSGPTTACAAHEPDGTTWIAYGGDFGEVEHDGNFVCDGLVSADREPHPLLGELAALTQPVAVEAAGPRTAAGAQPALVHGPRRPRGVAGR